MAALDQIIVAALIALPQSYLLWFHSREFDAPEQLAMRLLRF